MRWLITLLLLLLVVAGVGLLAFPDRVLPAVGVVRPAAAVSESNTTLDALRADQVTAIELTRGDDPAARLELVRDPAGRWTQPGGWAVREKEADELVAAVTALKTRYQPVPLDDPAKFGLTGKAVAVTARTAGKDVKLTFGRAADGAAYVRVGEANEVLRVGADVMQVVSRSPEQYRRRQLFPDAPRVKLFDDAAGSPALLSLPADRITAVTLDGPDGTFTVRRTAPNPAARRDPDRPTGGAVVFPTQVADGWELNVPAGPGTLRDRLDPAKLKGLLTAVPDLWADGFADPDGLAAAVTGYLLAPQLPLDLGTIARAADPTFAADVAARVTGFSRERIAARTTPPGAVGGGLLAAATRDRVAADYPPERAITVTRADGTATTLRIGGVARTVDREEQQQTPMGPVPRKVSDPYHFARFDANPRPFDLRGDRFADLFAKPDDLRDAALARFTADEAQAVSVTIPPKPREPVAAVGGAAVLAGPPPEPTTVTLTKKKGNKFAPREDDRDDRWYVGDRLAEAGKVTELLDALAKLEAKTPADRLDAPAPPAGFDRLDGFSVSVTARAKVNDGDPEPPARTYTFNLLGRNPATKKLAVGVAGWPRLNLVDDAVIAQADRGPLAYRSRRLFDTAEATLDRLTVTTPAGPAFELASAPKPDGGTEKAWRLTKPVALDPDAAKAVKLAGDLSRLEAAEYVDDAPRPDSLAGYGLDKPRHVIDLGFSGAGAKPQKLEIGAARPGKQEAFARLNGGGVFAVPQSLVESLDRGALDLLPTQLWTATPEQVTAVGVERGADKYTLTRDAAKWKLSGPFEASASATDATQLATSVAALKVDKYDALAVDPAKHGLDQPALKLSVTVREKQGDADVPVTRTLLVGKPADGVPPPPAAVGQPPAGPGRYAKLADGPNPAVFVLPAAAFAAADKPALGWLDRTLLALDPTTLTKVQIAGTDAVTLTKDGQANEWKADGFTVDRQAVGNLVFTAANPPVVRLAAYGPAVKWDEFGLDKPAVAVTVSTGGDKPETHTLKLGKEEPSGERYVRVDDGPAVGVVSGASGSALARGKLDLADRTLLAFDPTQLTGVRRKKGKDEFELAQGLGWDVVKPAKFKADAVTVEELADQLSRLRAVKVAALDAADPKAFGLDAPAAEVELAVGLDKPKTIGVQVGKPVDDARPDGDRFVRIDKAGPVKVLAAAVANKLLADPIKFKDKTLAKFVDADQLTISRGDRTATFAKVDGTWKMTGPTTADAEQADLDELVNTAAKLRADELAAEKPTDLKPYGLDKPVVTLQFFSGDRQVLGVLVGKFDGDTRRAFGKVQGGDAVAVFDTAVSGKLLAEYRKRAVWAGVDAAQVQSLAVSAGTADFAFTKLGPTWIDSTKPDDSPDPAKIADTLAALAGLKAERFAADKDADLKLYGLATPSRVIVLGQPNGESRTLHLGGEVGGTNGKQVYARVADPARTDVFVLSEADTAKLTRDRAGYKK